MPTATFRPRGTTGLQWTGSNFAEISAFAPGCTLDPTGLIVLHPDGLQSLAVGDYVTISPTGAIIFWPQVAFREIYEVGTSGGFQIITFTAPSSYALGGFDVACSAAAPTAAFLQLKAAPASPVGFSPIVTLGSSLVHIKMMSVQYRRPLTATGSLTSLPSGVTEAVQAVGTSTGTAGLHSHTTSGPSATVSTLGLGLLATAGDGTHTHPVSSTGSDHNHALTKIFSHDHTLGAAILFDTTLLEVAAGTPLNVYTYSMVVFG